MSRLIRKGPIQIDESHQLMQKQGPDLRYLRWANRREGISWLEAILKYKIFQETIPKY